MVTPFLPFKKEGVVAYLAKNCVGERMGIALSCSTKEPYAIAKSRCVAAGRDREKREAIRLCTAKRSMKG